MSEIVAFILFLPKLFDLLGRLGALIQGAKAQAWLNSLEDALTKAEKAETPKEFQDAAHGLVNAIRTS